MYSLVLLGWLSPSVPSQPFEKAPAVGGPGSAAGRGTQCYPPAPGRGKDGSVILEEGEEVIVAAAGEVGGAQVGEQLVRIRQLGQELGAAVCDDRLPADSAHPPAAAGVPSQQQDPCPPP